MLSSTAFINVAVNLVMTAAEAFQPLPAVCPPGWLTWQDSCYIVLPDRMDWFQASQLCDRPGSSLVVPDSQQEQDFIWWEMKMWMEELGAKMQDGFELWIGCEDPENRGDGLLCLGMKGNPTYTHWDPDGDEPNKEADQCVRMAKESAGKWRDTNCRKSHFVACEMRVSRRVYCLPSDADGRFTTQCLLNHHIKNLTTTGVTACGQACWAEPRCHSFNLRQQADNMTISQLNNANRLKANIANFKQVENCAYFKL